MNTTVSKEQTYVNIIKVVSVIIPIAVAILLFTPVKFFSETGWVKMLPHLNAMINSLTALLLISAVVMVKRGNVEWHKKLMTSALMSSNAVRLLIIAFKCGNQ